MVLRPTWQDRRVSASQEPMPSQPAEPGAGSPYAPVNGSSAPHGSDAFYPPPGPDGPYTFGPAEPAPPRPRPWRRTLAVAVYTGLVVAVAGAVLGVIWHFVSPTVPVLDAGASGIVVNDPSPEEYIAADGWFTLLGFAFGLVAAVVAWMVRRPDRGPGLLLGVTLGALAAAPVAWQVGRRLGLGAYDSWRETATSGATYHAPPDLHAHGALLVPAFAAVIVTTLLAGWSNDPDLDQPGAKPGYGREVQRDYPSTGGDIPPAATDPATGLPAGWSPGGAPGAESPNRYDVP
jgi:hypothetical protein